MREHDLRSPDVSHGGPSERIGIHSLGYGEGSFPSTIEHREHRFIGQLERESGVPELPPTPITSGAVERLTEWGMDEEQIKALREMSSSYRYDLCVEKCQRIGKTGGILYQQADTGGWRIALPHFFETKGRGDGQCADIARQFLTRIDNTGYLQQTPDIVPVLQHGYSRTHFNRDTLGHVWSGLLQEGEPAERTVTVDPSFQEISLNEENGYNASSTRKVSEGIKSLYTHSIIAIGDIVTYSETDATMWMKEREILGVSADRRLAYGVSFLRDQDTNLLMPAIQALVDDGEQEVSPMAVLIDGKVRYSWDHEPGMLGIDHYAEIVHILGALEHMPIEYNQEKGSALARVKEM